jgi:hypothetical protein
VSLAELETDRAPDYVHAVVGWRFWDAVEPNGLVSLSSPYFPTVWPAGEPLRAECVTRPLRRWVLRRFGGEPHPAPTERCSCGIYALAGKAFRDMVWDLGQCPVVGRVSLWGEVHEHEHGWRASFAYPEYLYVARRANARGARRLVEGLRRYGTPVEILPLARAELPDALGELISSCPAAEVRPVVHPPDRRDAQP